MSGSELDMKSQILIISPEPWEGHFVSKHHYAVTLASKGYKVYFLSPPDNSLSGIQIHSTNYQNLWEITAPQVGKGLRLYPRKLRNVIEGRWLEKLESVIGRKFATVWLFENSRFYDMDFVGNRTKIYHQVDLNQNFHVSKAASTADICFCTTEFIKKEILPYNENVYKVHHAVATYDKNAELSKEQRDNFAINSINAAYIGNLDMAYLDVELLSDTVRSFPNVLFHFVGTCRQVEPLYKACGNLTNVCWWGRVESQLIPEILMRSDVLLLTYKMEHYRDQASPHKVMEYLSSGKVTVATYTDEYKDKCSLLKMVDDSKGFQAAFERVVNDLSFYNSLDKQKERNSFASNNTYSKQLDTIISYLEQNNLHL